MEECIRYLVYRTDDNGLRILMRMDLEQTEADRLVERYAKGAHKQGYFALPYRRDELDLTLQREDIRLP